MSENKSEFFVRFFLADGGELFVHANAVEAIEQVCNDDDEQCRIHLRNGKDFLINHHADNTVEDIEEEMNEI